MMTNEEVLELFKNIEESASRKDLFAFSVRERAVIAFAQAIRDQEAAKHSPQWQPIETAPNDYGIDVWIVSLDNPEFGVRVTGVHRVGARWVGIPDYYLTDRVFPAYWMPLPAAPKLLNAKEV